ncbi:hypothetical protein IKE71_03570 [Candidatus Saccharibacteria bacterium]|nr:hypothetical protein [Candidatus Saccharibacteria bacterium]
MATDNNLDYVSQYTENTEEVASFVYAGLQTKKRNGTFQSSILSTHY